MLQLCNTANNNSVLNKNRLSNKWSSNSITYNFKVLCFLALLKASSKFFLEQSCSHRSSVKMKVSARWAIPRTRLLLLMLRSFALKLELLLKLFSHEARLTNSSYCFGSALFHHTPWLHFCRHCNLSNWNLFNLKVS